MVDHHNNRPQAAREARLELVRLTAGLASKNALSQIAVDKRFVADFNEGTVEIPEWVRASVKKLSTRTLARWRAYARKNPVKLEIDKGLPLRGKGSIAKKEMKTLRLSSLALFLTSRKCRPGT